MMYGLAGSKIYNNVGDILEDFKKGEITPPGPYDNATLESLAQLTNNGAQTLMQEAIARHHGQWGWVWTRAANIQYGKKGPPFPAPKDTGNGNDKPGNGNGADTGNGNGDDDESSDKNKMLMTVAAVGLTGLLIYMIMQRNKKSKKA